MDFQPDAADGFRHIEVKTVLLEDDGIEAEDTKTCSQGLVRLGGAVPASLIPNDHVLLAREEQFFIETEGGLLHVLLYQNSGHAI